MCQLFPHFHLFEGHIILERKLLEEKEETDPGLAERARPLTRASSSSSMSSSGISSVTITWYLTFDFFYNWDTLKGRFYKNNESTWLKTNIKIFCLWKLNSKIQNPLLPHNQKIKVQSLKLSTPLYLLMSTFWEWIHRH